MTLTTQLSAVFNNVNHSPATFRCIFLVAFFPAFYITSCAPLSDDFVIIVVQKNAGENANVLKL